MKIIAFILFSFVLNFFGYAQDFDQMNLDSLVHSHLSEYSEQTGNAILLSGKEQRAIVFFEKVYLDSVKVEKDSSVAELPLFDRPRPGVSLVQLLSFDEESDSFQKSTVDTLDVNLGWSGCHMTEYVDSAAIIKHRNSSSLVLLMCHPVVYSCSSMTYYYMKSYSFTPSSTEFMFSEETLEPLSVYPHKNNWREKAFKQIKWSNNH
jgi:hypothetical protein